MKKILTVAFVVLILCATAITTFAASGSFVSSPSGKLAPELIEASNASEKCEAEVKVCAYADRHTLGADAAAKLEAAYSSIVSTSDLGTLTNDVKELAALYSISSDKLSVSDLFDVYYTDCDDHDDHGTFTIKLKFEVIQNFAGLLHYTANGWELVDCKLNADTGELTFTVDSLSPFAVIVHDGSAVMPVEEKDDYIFWKVLLDVAIAGAAVTLGVLVYRRLKKPNTEAAEAETENGSDGEAKE